MSVKLMGMYRPHDRVTMDPVGPSKTRQEFADECDINSIMKRYGKTGVLSHLNEAQPAYGDFSAVPNFMDALNYQRETSEAFMRLPSAVRKRFGNDPMEFAEYASDAKNLEQMREWGLAKPVEPPAPVMDVRVVGDDKPAQRASNEAGEASK